MAEMQTFVCGLDAAIDVVGGKWKVLILWALKDAPARFGELKRALDGVSEKMLIQHLRELERDEVVHREVWHVVPPKVEYSLTPLGRSLIEALGPLGAWGCRHKERLEGIRNTPVEQSDSAR
ncbi:winged helix-turn-helix transcriptional regulator [Amycolatopsis sp. CA-230715]|uniref:winged helix-turn-helix transcriptional regulator n=1 Tax=Amycolatopsis sp. CA-230715 TaxID=2745196 RepID=UPI001C0372B6|nr:helix-turn-helix domain-containing protein [Amycolatopsis sp. CA-230715]QWF83430.1 HTH-type transcriptional activator HxlR [Amycolatopsis sp. CA-230715]